MYLTQCTLIDDTARTNIRINCMYLTQCTFIDDTARTIKRAYHKTAYHADTQMLTKRVVHFRGLLAVYIFTIVSPTTQQNTVKVKCSAIHN